MSTTPDRVRLRHKVTEAEHDFHPRTVERWKAAGWEPIADDEQSDDVDDAPQLDTADALDDVAPTPPDDVEPAPRSRATSSTASSSTRA
jgi:hypothetical protein